MLRARLWPYPVKWPRDLDPQRVALAGESVGGGLAVATAMMARDKGVQMPAAVVAVYPIAGTDTTTPSYGAHADAKPLNREMMSWFFEHYLRDPQDRHDRRVNLVAADLEGSAANDDHQRRDRPAPLRG